MHFSALFFTVLLLFSGYSFCNGTPIITDSECGICKFMANMLHNLWGEKTLDECLGELMLYLCEEMKVSDNVVCRGLVTEYKDEFIWIAGQIIVTPSEICGILLKDCGSIFDPYNVTWNANIPGNKPSISTVEPPQVSSSKLNVLHLTDLHIDWKYMAGTEASCAEPLCCRNAANNTNHENVKLITNPAGRWGMYGKCDAPYQLFVNLLQHIQETQTTIDYIILSGDLESHADWEYTRDEHVAAIRNITRTLKLYLPGIPVYFAMGNHEPVPHDNFAPRFVPKKFQMDWLYNVMADEWKEWIDDSQLESLRYRGSYMKKLFPGLRIISLNNAIDEEMNFYMYINQTDPDGSLQWLIDQLLDAERNGDKVQIVAHVPGSAGDALEGWAINYYKVVNRFEQTIVAQFFGHTHSEQFYLTYEDPTNHLSRPTSVVYSAPSLTPNYAFNPAYRIYTVDGNYTGSSYQTLDWTEWYFDLSEANKGNPSWKVLYSSVLKEYGLSNLLPTEWNKMINRMGTDQYLSNTYYQNFYRRLDMGTCNEDCTKNMQCSARKMHHSDKLCEDLKIIPKRNGRTTKKSATQNFDLLSDDLRRHLEKRVHRIHDSANCKL